MKALVLISFLIFFIYLFVKYSRRFKEEKYIMRGTESVASDFAREYINIGCGLLAFFLLFVGPAGWIMSALIVVWLIFVVNRKEK